VGLPIVRRSATTSARAAQAFALAGGLLVGFLGAHESLVVVRDVAFGVLHSEHRKILQRRLHNVHQAIIAVGIGRLQVEAIFDEEIHRVRNDAFDGFFVKEVDSHPPAIDARLALKERHLGVLVVH
jgi:hypothetical protein